MKTWCREKRSEFEWLGFIHSLGFKKPPKRIVCPDCKRRFEPYVYECDDPGCMHYCLPPHKRIIRNRKCSRKHSLS